MTIIAGIYMASFEPRLNATFTLAGGLNIKDSLDIVA